MRARTFLLAALVAGGCKEPAGDDAGNGGDSSGALPSPYADSGEETSAELPTMEADEVVATAVSGLGTFLSLQPDAVIAAYESLAVMEAGCPETQDAYEEDGATILYWYTELGCTTSAGVEFRGGGRFDRTTTDVGGVMVDAATLSSEGGTLRVSAAGGRWFEMTGYVGYTRGVGESTEAAFELVGSFSADSETASGSPLLDGSIEAQGYLYSYDDGGYKAVGGAGSLSGDGLGAAARAFSFADLWLLPGCAVEPLGTVSVRDDAGFWHDVVFDAGEFAAGQDEEPTFNDAHCNGCGAYLAGGQPLGEACLTPADVDGLLDWDGAPW